MAAHFVPKTELRLDERHGQCFLRGKMAVQRSLCDTRTCAYVGEIGTEKSLPVESVRRCQQQALLGAARLFTLEHRLLRHPGVLAVESNRSTGMLADMLRLGNEQVPVSNEPLFVALGMSGEEGFDTTVPRRLVHREAVAEVLLTRWVRRRTGEFWICAQLPRAHAFYQSQQGSADPLLVLETIRQAGLLVAHLGAGVPLEDRFVMRGMSYAVDSSALRVRDRPVDVQLLLRTRDVRVRPGHTSALGIEVELYRDGRRFGQGSGSMGTFPPAVYTRLRPPRVPAQATAGLPVPIDPVRVGRRDPADVVLSRGNAGNRWLLRVDTRHPALFDHPVDHVPGMVVFEAMRQAVHALAGPGYLASCQARTTRFVELDETAAGNVEVHALAASGGLFWTAVEQHGKRAASAVWRLSGNGGQFGPVS